MVKALITPELYVSNLQESLGFYVDICGFSILYERKEERFVMLDRGGAQIMLEEHGHGRNWITAELNKPYGRGVNFQIEVDHVDLLYKKANERKAAIFLPLEEKYYRTDHGEAGNKQFILQDPDGYLLRFFEDLGVKKHN